MISLSSALADGLDVKAGTRVQKLRRDGSGWTLFAEVDAEIDKFDSVLVALPAPQAVELLSDAPDMHAQAGSVEMAPCWAGMYVFPEPLSLGFDGAFLSEKPLSWVARDSSKPGRPPVEAWVLHAGPGWTHENLAMEGDEAAKAILEEFRALIGPTPDPIFQRAHRWAFALASDPVPHGALFDEDLKIGACGDWCMGGRIEGALLSGIAAARRILQNLK
jgi:predicted NAD/FAD-dependent oxidoreductase